MGNEWGDLYLVMTKLCRGVKMLVANKKRQKIAPGKSAKDLYNISRMLNFL